MTWKSLAERTLFPFPRLHSAVLIRRPNPDINKLAWIKLVQRGQTVLDVGANRGVYTSFFAHRVASAGRVFAFEPVPQICGELRRRCARLPNVTIDEVALADQPGEGTICVPGADFQQASLVRQSEGSWKSASKVQQFPVRVSTLDEWVREIGLTKIDFIKVDIEGAELKFVLGAAGSLRRFRPQLYLELSRHWLRGFGATPADVAGTLSTLGYSPPKQPVIHNRQLEFVPVSPLEIDSGDFWFSPI